MNNTNTGGPAFPTTVRNHHDAETGGQWSEHIDQGMTLRDYFAAKAMQGLISCPDWRENVGEEEGIDASDCTARAAYMMADAMLKAREA